MGRVDGQKEASYFGDIQEWARLVVARAGEQGQERGNNVRTLFKQLAVVEGAGSVLGVLGWSFSEAVKTRQQWWRLDKTSEWERVTVVEFFSSPTAAWQTVANSELPVFSTQVPPAKDTRERANFDRTVIAGWGDDQFGVSRECTVLNWREMQRAGYSSCVVEEAKRGMQVVLTKAPKPFMAGGDKRGHYPAIWPLETELAAIEAANKNPAGGPIVEGPLSYVPRLVASAIAVKKLKAGEWTYRVCFDHAGSGANDCMEHQECILPTIDSLARLMTSEGWIIKKDGKSAFVHHPIGSDIADLFGQVRLGGGGVFRRRLMDFGSRVAPATCQRFAQETVRLMWAKRVRMIIFVDDHALAGRNQQETRAAEELVDENARRIGYRFDPGKREEGQVVVILGVEMSTIGKGVARLPPAKVTSYCNNIDEWLKQPAGTMETLASLCGRLNFTSPFIRSSATRLMNLFRDLWSEFVLQEDETGGDGSAWILLSAFSLENQGTVMRKTLRGRVQQVWVQKEKHKLWDKHSRVSLSQESIQDLRWWRTALRDKNGQCLHLQDEIHKGRWNSQIDFGTDKYMDIHQSTRGAVPIVTSDASRTESAAHGGFYVCGSKWRIDFSETDRQKHIADLELEAAIRGIQTVAESRVTEEDGRLLLRCDNMSVVGMMNRGCSPVSRMNQELQVFFDWCESHKIEIRTKYIPTKENTIADALSRRSKDHTPDAGVLVLSERTEKWLEMKCREQLGEEQPQQQQQHGGDTKMRIFPGSQRERPGEVMRRKWVAWGKEWEWMWSKGFRVWIPSFDEVGPCLAEASRRGQGVIVLVPADKVAHSRRWWHDYASLATNRWILAHGETHLWSLHTIVSSSASTGLGDWRPMQEITMEAWVFRSKLTPTVEAEMESTEAQGTMLMATLSRPNSRHRWSRDNESQRR